MKIKNRSASTVVYSVPEMNVHRRFAPGEIKTVSKEEIESLIYQPGGLYLLQNSLQMTRSDAEQFNLQLEKEYFLSEDGVQELILRGSLEEFLDALDFAPRGVIGLIKEYAVGLPMTDINKLEALKNKTGFDAMSAINNVKAIERDSVEEISSAKQRRVTETPADKKDVVLESKPKYTIKSQQV